MQMAPRQRKYALALPAAGCIAAAPWLFVSPSPAAPSRVPVQSGPLGISQQSYASASDSSHGTAAVAGAAAAMALASAIGATGRTEKTSMKASKGRGDSPKIQTQDDGFLSSAPIKGADDDDEDFNIDEFKEKPKPRKKVKQFDPKMQLGSLPPLDYWDPLGFCKEGDEYKEKFRNYRIAELKHGRVAMMASTGLLLQSFFRFPGDSWEVLLPGVRAVLYEPARTGFLAILALSGILELFVWTEDPNKEPGDFGDPANLGDYSEESRHRELNNGRFAMFAVVGIMAADLYTGKDAWEQFGFDTL
eukprot:TRINITY_DN109783_c0_g1_i1.p1 TRINITY_DN109783_c0_g1~~TRINITY_DN109783_c0_g1_i1.p1  ORF type:complete len:304 (-),score=83.63 TRINITY_DN109783_c0_g1_i1:129-1040(-)